MAQLWRARAKVDSLKQELEEQRELSMRVEQAEHAAKVESEGESCRG